MATFGFYCLDPHDQIMVGDNLDVLDLEAAIQAAYHACKEHPHFSSSRIEVWQGASRLYTSRDSTGARV
jgi:hypothetical protein